MYRGVGRRQLRLFVVATLLLVWSAALQANEEVQTGRPDYDAASWLLVPPAHSIQREAQHFLLPPPEQSGKPPHHQVYADFLSSSFHTHHVPVGAPEHAINSTDAVQLMALVLIRHGDRTPTYVFQNSLSEWPEGSGQLTGLGMKQQHDLGAMLRHRYVNERNLIEPYWRLDQVYCRSTARTRSLQSAEAFFHGFFPPGTGPNLPESEGGGPALPINIQPVPIMSASRYNDTLLYAYKNCPTLKRLIKENKQQPEWQRLSNENQQLFAQLTQIFGEPIGLKHMTKIRTLLNAERIHGKPQLDGITAAMWDKINELGAWVLKSKFRTHEMGKLAIGDLPVEIRNRMKNILIEHYMVDDEEKAATEASPRDSLSPHSIELRRTYSEPSFVLYSAHDGTILALLSALQAKNTKVPYFGAFVTFELFAPINEDPPFVKLWFDDQPLRIPGCDHVCTFANFSAVVEQSHEPDWHRACDIPWLRPLFNNEPRAAADEGAKPFDPAQCAVDEFELRALRTQLAAQQELIEELQAALDYRQLKKDQKQAAEERKLEEKEQRELEKKKQKEQQQAAEEKKSQEKKGENKEVLKQDKPKKKAK